MTIIESRSTDLKAIADCFMLCFPDSFAVLLGNKTVEKSLEWFLKDENRFLIHVEANGVIVGFMGGFSPQFVGDGAKSGMLRQSFKTAFLTILTKPSLLFHEEVRKYVPAFIKNIYLRIRKPVKKTNTATDKYFENVLISTMGVHPAHRRNGYAQMLLSQAEMYGAKYNRQQLHLSVKKKNTSAIEAYTKAGWFFSGELKDTYHFEKKIS